MLSLVMAMAAPNLAVAIHLRSVPNFPATLAATLVHHLS
jgi:hypothetical protein